MALPRARAFSPDLAQAIGLDEALFVAQVDFWYSETNSGKEVDGERYIYNSYKQWHMQFNWWGMTKLKDVIRKCKEAGYIISVKAGKGYDQTRGYRVDYDVILPLIAAIGQSTTNAVGYSDTMQGSVSDQCNTEITHKTTNKKKTTVDVATVMNNIEHQPDEDELRAGPEHISGPALSLWWRALLKYYGHAKGLLPELTIKQQGQLKQLMKKLGSDGPTQVYQALKHWEDFRKFVKKDYGKQTYNPKNIQKFVLLADALSEYQPPEEEVPMGSTKMMSLKEKMQFGSDPIPIDPDKPL